MRLIREIATRFSRAVGVAFHSCLPYYCPLIDIGLSIAQKSLSTYDMR